MWHSSLKSHQSCKQNESRKAIMTWPSDILDINGSKYGLISKWAPTDCNILPCHRHCSLLAGCHWNTTLQKVQLTTVFSKSAATLKIPRDVYHTLRMREIFSAIFINLCKLRANCNDMPQCATTFPTIPLITPLTYLPKLLQPLQCLTVVLWVLAIVYLNILGQKRGKSMLSSFNIQY